MKRFVFAFLLTLFLNTIAVHTLAQQGTTISLKGVKPPEQANKTLRAEKTGYDKLPRLRKFLQNTYTHYNYLFNANQIFNTIMQDAVAANVDDYSQLLSFYPFDENSLKSNAGFDSVIQHATSGLLLHDLRNDYVDELYYVLGKSYFYEKKLDTAQQTFKFLNYAFAPKDEGYDIPIGSNISNSKDKSFSISNKEAAGLKTNNLKNINRRNDALVWLAKTFIEQKEYTQAGILLNNIGRDIHFPERLKPLYLETKSYFFYKQKMYDSTAAYLSLCNFDNDTKFLKARRAFLAAQLFQLSGNDSNAVRFYKDALTYGNNPVIDIYAQKNIILLQQASTNKTAVENALNSLLRKNKYYLYKDLIYYNQAEIAKSNNDNEKAKQLLWQSIKTNSSSLQQNQETKSTAFLLLGNIEYDQNLFDSASHHYDSVSANNIKDTIARSILQKRTVPLNELSGNLDSIHVQDSLLALANMPEKDRMNILKKKAKEIRRAIDQREETDANVPINSFVKQNQQPIDLFGQSGNSTTWYFNNPALRSSGYQLFKQKFGNRPNVDNWRRLSAISKTVPVQNNANGFDNLTGFNSNGSLAIDSANITPEDLLLSLPMTQEKKDSARKIITKTMLDNGEILMNKLENFSGAIVLLDSLINKYPKAEEIPNALYDQYVCYMLLDKSDEANNIKQKILNNYASSAWAEKLKNVNTQPKISATSIANAATKEYSDIYDLFLEGNFDEALKRKNIADKKYGNFYWTPQMLYIEAIYFATKRNDSAAIKDLNFIVNNFSSSPMVPQAKDLIEILKHRKEIEDYLARLKVKPEDYSDGNLLAELERGAQRMNEEKRVALNRDSIVKFNLPPFEDQQQNVNATSRQLYNPPQEDTSQAIANKPTNVPESNIDSLNTIAKQSGTDTSQSNENLQNKNVVVTTDSSTNANNVATNIPQQNNVDTTQNIIPKQRTDTTSQATNNNLTNIKPANKNQPSNQPENEKKPENRGIRNIGGFTFDDNAPVYVTVVLSNVDPVYATEGTNAFNRYNLFTFPNQNMNVASQKMEEDNLIIIGPFKNTAEAKSYQAKVQPQASVQIVPWIKADKYFFLKISPQNLQKIHSKTDMEKYRAAAIQAGNE